MLRIKSAQFGYGEPHDDSDPGYGREARVTVEIDREHSETKRPYIVHLIVRYSPSDNSLESAEVQEMEPRWPGDSGAVPQTKEEWMRRGDKHAVPPHLTNEEWVRIHWQEISEADPQ